MAEDNKKENKEVNSSKNTEKEVKNTKPKEQVVQLLHEIANALDVKLDKKNEETGISEEKYRVPSLRFQEISNKAYDSIADILNKKHDSIWKKYKIDVKLIDNIDIKDGSNEKFYIKLTDSNGNTTTIDLLHYQRNIYDYSVNEEESIKNQILKLKGIYDKNIVDASKEIADYISLALGYKEAFYYQYKLVGWDSIDNKVIFKYDKIYSREKVERKGFCGEEWAEALKLNQITEESQEEAKWEWIKLMTETFNDKPKADIVLSAAVSGLVRQVLPYTKETNININIVGQKASGKSTMQHLLLGFFGDPQYLEGSFYDSDNANEKIRAERAVIPFILDERMLKVEGQSEKKKAYNIVLDIFKEYEGKVKQRVNGGDSSGLRTYGAIISSSVDSIFDKINTGLKDENNNIRDLGQYRRFIEIVMSKEDFFNSADNAREAEEMAYSKYGYGVRLVVKYMLRMMEYSKTYEKLLDSRDSIKEVMTYAHLVMMGEKTLDTDFELESNNRSAFDVFNKLFKHIVKEIRDTMQRSIDNKNIIDKDEYKKYINEADSSVQRFALLILTAYIVNGSLQAQGKDDFESIYQIKYKKCSNSKETEENEEDIDISDYVFSINTDEMLVELIGNAFEKFEKAEILKEEIKMNPKYLAVKLYDWFNKYQDYCNKYGENEFIAQYKQDGDKMNLKIAKSGNVTLGKLLANTDATPEEILACQYENKPLKNKGLTKSQLDEVFETGIIKEVKERNRYQISNLKNLTALFYQFDIDEIKRYKSQLEKQEVAE